MVAPSVPAAGGRAPRGFTLIELLVVLAIVALMLTIAAPRYVDHVQRAREAALRTSLKVMRDAIDAYASDRGRLPATLEDLVERRYLREVPLDPITDRRDTWVLLGVLEAGASAGLAADGPAAQGEPGAGIADVRSGAEGSARDGTAYRDW